MMASALFEEGVVYRLVRGGSDWLFPALPVDKRYGTSVVVNEPFSEGLLQSQDGEVTGRGEERVTEKPLDMGRADSAVRVPHCLRNSGIKRYVDRPLDMSSGGFGRQEAIETEAEAREALRSFVRSR
jgi:hypothetical protein